MDDFVTDDADVIAAFFEEAGELLQELEGCLLALEASPADGELVNRSFRCAHTIKGNSSMLGLDAVTELSHAMENVLASLRERRFTSDRGTVGTLLAAADALGRLLEAVRGGRPVPPELREVRDQLKALAQSVDRPTPTTVAVPTAPTGRGATTMGSAAAGQASDDHGSLRVAVEKVDKLVDLAGELAITQSMVAQLTAGFSMDKLTRLREAVADMERNARELQQRVMNIRMLPLRKIFARLPRLVRDLAVQCGKDVVLAMAGEDTELDKSVIERIADPLMHLVRNAVDHGIELPEARLQGGKPRHGTLRLDAHQQGGSIFIEVADDGSGLDRERILRRASERGLVTADAAPADEELWSVIFEPGFSTTDRVTDVSGRGVGMDVVRRTVLALGGSIGIESHAGVGTRFRIVLPLTLAILDAQLLQVGAQVYALPLVNIIESLRPRPGEVRMVLGRGEVLTVRGEVLPILRLHQILGVEPTSVDPCAGLLVIVESDRSKVALLVDQLLEQQQIVIKSLETNFRRVEGIAAATILGDGRVALIVDVPALIGMVRSTRQRGVAESSSGHPVPAPRRGAQAPARSLLEEGQPA